MTGLIRPKKTSAAANVPRNIAFSHERRRFAQSMQKGPIGSRAAMQGLESLTPDQFVKSHCPCKAGQAGEPSRKHR
ncbi:hypothetical protein, partial [Mesorhizobium sp. M0019]|uniref:hypothetical protein n=1 Tax=Mesorhizobium sp. M0019 TaxID=2956845 RepID=UPI0033375787